MALKELSDGGPEGSRFGRDADDLISTYGATPATQIAYSGAMAFPTLTVLSGGSNYGFATSAQFAAFHAHINSITTVLIRFGLLPTA